MAKDIQNLRTDYDPKLGRIEEVHLELREFRNEFHNYRDSAIPTLEKVKDLHSHVNVMQTYVHNLSTLPQIATSLQNLEHRLLKLLALSMLGIGFIFVLLIMRDSRMNLKVPGGFELQNNNQKTENK